MEGDRRGLGGRGGQRTELIGPNGGRESLPVGVRVETPGWAAQGMQLLAQSHWPESVMTELLQPDFAVELHVELQSRDFQRNRCRKGLGASSQRQPLPRPARSRAEH